MLLRLYYLYENSSKKSSYLAYIVKILSKYLISHRVVVVPSDPVGQSGLHTTVRPYNACLIDTGHISLTFLLWKKTGLSNLLIAVA